MIDAELLVDKRQNDPPSAIEGDGDCRQQRSRQQNVNGTSLDELWLSKETAVPASRVKAQPTVRGEVDPRSEREIIEAALAESRGRVSGPSGAAARLGIPRSTLESRIRALMINKTRFKFG